MPPTDHNGQDLSFAELLEDYEIKPLTRGQYVQGEILQIDEKFILASVDAKRTAVIPPQDLAKIGEDELAKLSVGDDVPLYVLRTPEGGEDLLVSLNKGFEQRDWDRAQISLENEDLHELEVIGHNKGGLMVAFGRLRGFVPTSHVPQLQFLHNQQAIASQKAQLVGVDLPLTVIEVDAKRRRLILSAKQGQKELRKQRLLELKLEEGQAISAQIAKLVKFGAFVDLGGVEGLIHISEIAWEKVDNPADYLRPGQEIEVLIQSVDIERERISLSRKALLPSPWDTFAQTHNPGDLVEGLVTNVTDFGAFVMVAEGIEGLVHTSEMHGTKDFAPQDVLLTGDTILVRILDIQPEEQRMGLSQRQIRHDEEMEWIWQRQQDAGGNIDEEE